MLTTKKYVYVKKFDGLPKLSDFLLVTEDFDPKLEENEILCLAEYISIDAGIRAYANLYSDGIVMLGGQIAKVIDSKHAAFPSGVYVYGRFNWQTYTKINPNKMDGNLQPYILPDFTSQFPISLGLGYLGMPGNTALFGLMDICQPKKGETVCVTAAAGGVGSHVGQIAKIIGCRVIGIAGTDEKCDWIKNELGFDEAVNYKSKTFKEDFKKCVGTKGIDCYFDNVGGELSNTVIMKMNKYGRIAVCGAVSVYNENPDKMPKVHELSRNFIFNELKMQGFIVWRWTSRWSEGIAKNLEWLKAGKLKYRETIVNGFENTPRALIDVLEGKNIGKMIVKL